MTVPSSSPPCPGCGVAADGRFCSNCGTALAGASCATCSAAMTPGSHFCHRCGAPAGAAPATSGRGLASVAPWAVAAVALASVIALVVGQRFGQRPAGTTDVLDGANAQGSTVISRDAPPAGAMPRAPDISQMSPAQRAERLYDRIMREHEAGHADNVRTFMPMAMAAYEMLAPLNLDQRYDLGRLGEVAGDAPLARAQADSILLSRPTHLLGLALASRVARHTGDGAGARRFDARLLAAEPREKSAGLPEYLLHKQDIDSALVAARTRMR